LAKSIYATVIPSLLSTAKVQSLRVSRRLDDVDLRFICIELGNLSANEVVHNLHSVVQKIPDPDILQITSIPITLVRRTYKDFAILAFCKLRILIALANRITTIEARPYVLNNWTLALALLSQETIAVIKCLAIQH